MDKKMYQDRSRISDLIGSRKNFRPYVPPYRRNRELKKSVELKSSTSSLSDFSFTKRNSKNNNKMDRDNLALPSNVIQRIIKLANVYLNLDFKSTVCKVYKQEFDDDLSVECVKSLKFTVTLANPTVQKLNLTTTDTTEKNIQNDTKSMDISTKIEQVITIEKDFVTEKPTILNYEKIVKDFWVTIYSCNNVYDLWGVILDANHFEEVEKLAEQMKSFYSSKTSAMSSVVKGDFYAVHDGSWHRVKCLNFDSVYATVFFIDRGDRDTFPIKKMHTLIPEFCKLPVQAIKLSLAGLEVFSDLDDIRYILETLLLDKTINAKVVGVNQFENSCLSVQLYNQNRDKSIHINTVLISHIVEKFLDTMNFIELDTLMPCQVSHVNMQGHIFLRLHTKALKYFNTLMKIAVDKVINDDNYKRLPVKFDSDKIYFVFYVKDFKWYRAQMIMSISSDLILFYLIDVGSQVAINRQHCIALDKVCKILAKYPFQAIRVNLEQLLPLTESQIHRLQEITLKFEILYVKFKIVSHKTAPVVQLLHKTNDDFILSINDSLVLQNQASAPNDWCPSVTKNTTVKNGFSPKRSTTDDNWKPLVNQSCTEINNDDSFERTSTSMDRENSREISNNSISNQPNTSNHQNISTDEWHPSSPKRKSSNEVYSQKENKVPKNKCHTQTVNYLTNKQKLNPVNVSPANQNSCRLPRTKSKCLLNEKNYIDSNVNINEKEASNQSAEQCIPINKKDDWKPIDIHFEKQPLANNYGYPLMKESNVWDEEAVNQGTDECTSINKKNDWKPVACHPHDLYSSTNANKSNTIVKKQSSANNNPIYNIHKYPPENELNVWDEELLICNVSEDKSKVINSNENTLLEPLKKENKDDSTKHQEDLMNQLKKVFSTMELNNGTTVNIMTIEHQIMNHSIGKVLNSPKVPENNKYFDVHVVLAYDPSHFVVQILSNKNRELKELMEKMKEVCETYESPKLSFETIDCGQMYAIKGTGNDQQWYRVFIMKKINKEFVFVYYCDYGNYADVGIDKLKVLHNRFYTAPYQAIWCELYGISSSSNCWSVDNCLRFKKLTLGKDFVCSVVLKKDLKSINIDKFMPLTVETIYVVELIDTSTREDIYMTNLLVEEGHALDIRPLEEKGGW